MKKCYRVSRVRLNKYEIEIGFGENVIINNFLEGG